MMHTLTQAVIEHWPVWLVTVTLILAAVIDGWALKVPNWLTFPMVISGWVYSTAAFGWEGMLWSVIGTLVGLALLLPVYSIGGMGAGDVKLLAGVGAWMFVMLESASLAINTAVAMAWAFFISSVVGAMMAIGMVLWRKAWQKHSSQFWMILAEIWTLRSPTQLSEIAADRKSSMLLLPYGIPIAIGTIAYFAWTGMLV